jgi:hypothetical protein
VDDDQHMREALCELLTPLGLRALAGLPPSTAAFQGPTFLPA